MPCSASSSSGLYRTLTTDGWLRQLWERSKDPAVLRDLVYLLLVFFPLAMATFVVAVTAWAIALALVATPAYYGSDSDIGLQFGGGSRIDVDTLPEALVASLVGLVLLALLPWLLGLLAAAHAFTVRTLLGRRFTERVEHLQETRAGAVDAARRAPADRARPPRRRPAAAGRARAGARAARSASSGRRPARRRRARRRRRTRSSQRALAELRELARGIHPAVLTERGLARRSRRSPALGPSRSSLDVAVDERLPGRGRGRPPTSSSPRRSTNVAKHAQRLDGRGRASARGRRSLVVEIADDGVGGADTERGLRAARPRRPGRGARRHACAVASPAGGGTRVAAEIPCAS